MLAGARLTRDEFRAKLASLDAERLRALLWNVYSRCAAPLRERIEDLLAPPGERRPKGKAPVDSGLLRADVDRFVELARSGASVRSRIVSPKARSGWRTCAEIPNAPGR